MFLVLLTLLVAVLASVSRKLLNLLLPRQPRDVEGQVVLITGGAKGLGRHLAVAFADKKCKVAIADVDLENAVAVAESIGPNARPYRADISDLSAVERLRETIEEDLGPVDIVVNNAGLLFERNLTTEDPSYLRKMIDVNAMALFWTTRAFLPGMIARKRGHIVAISSVFGLMGMATAPTYSASKFAVRGFMESLAIDLSLQGHEEYVRTSTVFPYFVATNKEVIELYRASSRFVSGMLDPEKTARVITRRVLKGDEIIVVPSYMTGFLYDVVVPLWIKKLVLKYLVKPGSVQTRLG